MTVDIDSLLSRLFRATYKSRSIAGRDFDLPVISEENQGIIENTVREWYNEQLSEKDAEKACLEAKVYAYEQIIAKSNFAPFLSAEEVPEEKVEDISDGRKHDRDAVSDVDG